MGSLRDCFGDAVRILVGPGLAKQRLAVAWRNHLEDIAPEELPGQFRDDFGALRKAMHSATACGGLGVIEVSVRKMTEQEAGAHCACIAHLFAKLPEGPQRSAPALAPFPFRIAVGDE